MIVGWHCNSRLLKSDEVEILLAVRSNSSLEKFLYDNSIPLLYRSVYVCMHVCIVVYIYTQFTECCRLCVLSFLSNIMFVNATYIHTYIVTMSSTVSL